MKNGLGHGIRPHVLYVTALICALLATVVGTAPRANAQATYDLNVSINPDRSSAVPLAGETVAGDVYVFTTPETGVSTVSFYVDDVDMSGTPYRTEGKAPYDLEGGSSAAANPFDTTELADGEHTISAALALTDGTNVVLEAVFTVDNASGPTPRMTLDPTSVSTVIAEGDTTAQTFTVSVDTSDGGSPDVSVTTTGQSWLAVSPTSLTSPGDATLTLDPAGLAAGSYSATVTFTAAGYPNATLPVTLDVVQDNSSYDLLVSTSANRSNPLPLAGETVTGDIFVFTSPDDGVGQVRFFLDDSPTPVGVESKAPYDLAGTKSDGTANAFDTSQLADGEHTLTAAIDKINGLTKMVEAVFTVDSTGTTTPRLTADPTSTSLLVEEGSTNVQETIVSVDTTNGTTPTASVTTTGEAWLSVTSTSVDTPGDVTFSADPSGLAAGTYTATVSFGADGYTSVDVPVQFDVVAPNTTAYELLVSSSPDRSDAVALDGQSLTGDAYVFTSPDIDVTRVRFYIDDPEQVGDPVFIETSPPHDLQGTNTNGNANPYDTSQLFDGNHTLTAVLDLSNGLSTTVEAAFTTDNGTLPGLNLSPSSLSMSAVEGDTAVRTNTVGVAASDGGAPAVTVSTTGEQWLTVSPTSFTPPGDLTISVDPSGLTTGTYSATVTMTADGYATADLAVTLTITPPSNVAYDVLVSTNPDRSDPVTLEGQDVNGNIYVFTAPDTDVLGVSFYIDDPQMTGTPYRTEGKAPYDLNGGSASAANPYDTTSLPDGQHTITAAIQLGSGATEVVTRTFTITNFVPAIIATPDSLLFSTDEGDTAVQTAPLSVDTNNGGTPDVSVTTSGESWLSVTPTSLTSPGDVSVSVDPTGLAADSYTGTVTLSADSYPDTTVTVTFAVGVATGECGPLACSEALIQLPYELDFSADNGKILDKNGVGTGFTYIDMPSNGTGYMPENLEVDLTAGALDITTTSGLASAGANSLDNALGVGIDAPSQISVLSTTLLSPPAGSGQYEQAGLWFGNDEDNYHKLVVVSKPSGTVIEHLQELNGGATNKQQTGVLNVSASAVTLKLIVNPGDKTIKAQYIVDDGTPVSLGTFSAPGELFSFDAAGIDPEIGTRSFGGVFASNRNATTPRVYRFEHFSVLEDVQTVPTTWLRFDRSAHPVQVPTSMAWAPDGRLYVTELFGTIHALTFDQNMAVVDDEEITTLGSRLTLGITVDPESTPDDVILWTTHSSPSLNDGVVNSGVVSKLSGTGHTTKEDVITGLPRAKANHGLNSLHFGPDGRLYIAAGGNTGAGAPNNANTEFGDRPEQPLSAALLVADVKAADFQGDCATPLYEFGVPQTCDVQTFVTGLRNTYDFTFHSNGELYAPDNGLGVTGTYPPSPSPDCTGLADASTDNPGEQADPLNRLVEGQYYGHPNPYRNECVFKDGSYQNVAPLANYEPPMYDLGNNKSANGTIEYRGGGFCGTLDGDLLIANYSAGDDITRIQLSDDGRSVVAAESLVGDFNNPLPVAQNPDGVIFVGEASGDQVTILKPAETGCWETKQPLPTLLLDAGGAAVDGKVYVVGGKTSSTGHQSTVYAYDPAGDSWTTVADLPGEAVENPAIVAHNGKLYAFGGSTEPFSGAVSNAAVFDPGTGNWTSLPPLNTARSGANAAVIDGLIYVAGGMGADGASLDSVEVFDPTTETWSSTAPMSTRRDNAGVAAADGKLFVFGGRTRNASGAVSDARLATMEIYDPAQDAWTPGAAMPTGRRTMVVSTLRGRIQVIGGEVAGDGSAFDVAEEYDPATDSWISLQPMPTPRHGAASGTVDDTVYVVGGGPNGGFSLSDVNEAFSFPATGTGS